MLHGLLASLSVSVLTLDSCRFLHLPAQIFVLGYGAVLHAHLPNNMSSTLPGSQGVRQPLRNSSGIHPFEHSLAPAWTVAGRRYCRLNGALHKRYQVQMMHQRNVSQPEQ